MVRGEGDIIFSGMWTEYSSFSHTCSEVLIIILISGVQVQIISKFIEQAVEQAVVQPIDQFINQSRQFRFSLDEKSAGGELGQEEQEEREGRHTALAAGY